MDMSLQKRFGLRPACPAGRAGRARMLFAREPGTCGGELGGRPVDGAELRSIRRKDQRPRLELSGTCRSELRRSSTRQDFCGTHPRRIGGRRRGQHDGGLQLHSSRNRQRHRSGRRTEGGELPHGRVRGRLDLPYSEKQLAELDGAPGLEDGRLHARLRHRPSSPQAEPAANTPGQADTTGPHHVVPGGRLLGGAAREPDECGLHGGTVKHPPA